MPGRLGSRVGFARRFARPQRAAWRWQRDSATPGRCRYGGLVFYRSKKAAPTNPTSLDAVIAHALPDADSETRAIVTAIAGLFGSISYADREFSTAEKRIVRDLLLTIVGIGPPQADAIVGELDSNIIIVSTTEAPRFSRMLMQFGDRDLRLHVLDMLLSVAAADHTLDNDEVVLLRQITRSLGLDQADYNDLQSKHRDKLAALQPESSR